MLKELLPKYLAVAILIASLFLAALVLQAGIAIDLWIHRMSAPRSIVVKIHRAINLVLVVGSVLFIVVASVMVMRWGSQALAPKPELGVPQGWPSAP